ncbi:MAG: IPT/TIG domain-containing protein [Bryobacteraceae bacterium]
MVLPLVLGIVGARAQAPLAPTSINRGKVTILSAYGGPATDPGPLTEVSPGNFVSVNDAAGVILITSAGVVTALGQLQADGTFPGLSQAVNGRFYGAASTRQAYFSFSFDIGGNFQYYYGNVHPPGLSVATPDRNLYGVAMATGQSTLSSMSLAGALTTLHTFPQELPYVLPVLASDGNFYGISTLGGTHKSASVYRMTPHGDCRILVTYPDGQANEPPGGFGDTLIQASNGSLYGTAAVGGANRAGAIFELSLDGSGYKVLKEFEHLPTGAPNFLVEADDGNLYGVANAEPQLGPPSTLFRLTLDGKYAALQRIGGSSESCPCAMTQASDGKFYGNGGGVWVWDLGLPPPKPHIASLFPSSGSVGTVVTIWGKQLLGVTAVSFNGVPAAAFSNISGRFVSATVPSAATTGPVTLTNMKGTAASPGTFAVQ